MNYLDVVNFEAYVAGCAVNSKVVVLWDNPDTTPRTNGTTIWLPRLTSVTSNEWLTRIRYFVKHETSHIQHSDFAYLNKMRPSGLLALVNNLLEDHRIDYLNDFEYAGDSVTSNSFWLLYAEDINKRLFRSEDVELQNQQKLTAPLFIWDSSIRTWIDNATLLHDAVLSTIDEEGKQRLKLLQKYSSELQTLREIRDPINAAPKILDLSKRIVQDLYGADPEDMLDKESSTGEGLSSDVSDKPSKDKAMDVSKLISDMGLKHEDMRDGKAMTHEESSGGYSIPTADQYVIARFPHLPAAVRGFGGSKSFDIHTVMNYITSNAKLLSNKLRMKLQTRSRDRYAYGLKKGKLHNGSLHRILHGDNPSADKIFRQRIVSTTLDTAITLLVDCSGSMAGSKFRMACSGAGLFAEALRPLNIKYSVLGFTNEEKRDDPLIWVFTDFNERVTTNELTDRFAVASGCLWENTDGDAIAYASHQLRLRNENRKVLLVLSDGSPAGRRHAGDISNYTLQAVQHAEKSGIDIYGIGIMDTNVKYFYKKHIVVDNLTNLAPTILSIIDRSI